jgi:ABC-type multidrug transport system fused ATPase/permease subunit
MRQLALILTRREGLLLALLLVASLVMAAVEILGIAAITAFVVLVSDPTGAADNRMIAWLRHLIGASEGVERVTTAGLLLLAVIVFRNVASLAHIWMKLSVIHGMRRTVASRLLAAYLAHPYPYFLRTNSAEIIKNLTQEVDQFVASYLHGWVTMAADVVTAAAIFALMVFASPVASGTVVGILGLAGGALWLLSRRRVDRLGRINRELNEKRLRASAEAIGAIKDVKLLGREDYFVDRLARIYADIRRNTVAFNMITEAPRNVLEIVSVVAILLIFVVAFGETGSMAATAGIASLIVVALYRLMPVLHRILSGGYALRFSSAVRDAFARAMIEGAARLAERSPGGEPLPFEREIRFENVSFRYPSANHAALDALNLEIKRNSIVGLVGPSGAGKTTLVEILLGLLEANIGRVLVDGRPVDPGCASAWQRSVAYVPQSIYLADDSILRNIAFGVPDARIDQARAAEAARIAHLDEFIAGLPKGIDTATGERGVRLSGGQRQRIGIARAIYREAKLLVLDEATSALDGITESIIEQSIAELAGKMTVVIIAHRLTTVRRCNLIHLMDGGRIVASGGYEQLMRDSATFRAMARAAE